LQKVDSLHVPKKAALFSAIIPGAGQVYNNKFRPLDKKSKLWWKLPVIYGGLAASAYFAVQNNNQYKLFYTERRNRLDPNYAPQFYPDYTSDLLLPVQESYRKRRDYSIIGGLVIYLLNVVDANVEGHLIHFDASDNLAINVLPKINYINTEASLALGISLSFK